MASKKINVISELSKWQMQIKNVPPSNYSTRVWFLSTVTNAKWAFVLLEHVISKICFHLNKHLSIENLCCKQQTKITKESKTYA